MALAEGIKRGTVELLLLTLLKEQDMYGYQLAQTLEERSGGRYTLQESSMYPILYRLEDKGMISGQKRQIGKRRVRVYYHLEPAGASYAEALRKEYLSICYGVLSILGVTDLESMEKE